MTGPEDELRDDIIAKLERLMMYARSSDGWVVGECGGYHIDRDLALSLFTYLKQQAVDTSYEATYGVDDDPQAAERRLAELHKVLAA